MSEEYNESEYDESEIPGMDPSEESYQSENEYDDSPSEQTVTSAEDLQSRVDQLVNNKIGNLQQQQSQMHEREIENLRAELAGLKQAEEPSESVYDNFTPEQRTMAQNIVTQNPEVMALKAEIASMQQGQQQSQEGAMNNVQTQLTQVLDQARTQYGNERIQPYAEELNEQLALVGHNVNHPSFQRVLQRVDGELRNSNSNNRNVRAAAGSERGSNRSGTAQATPYIKDHNGKRVYSVEKQMDIAMKEAARHRS
jgi:hypothetical protein|tara:strand:- start:2820 stop:3581 length:762 start_codon:yes stop_codon:yes gene_type:complete